MSVDETTDTAGRYVANVLVGKLQAEEYHAPVVVNCAFLEKTDANAIARLVDSTMKWIDPEFDNTLILAMVTDSAAYMLKAGSNLKIFYPKLKHLTCLAHALHRLAEKLREMFSDVNDLISNVKRIFLKAPSRIATWKGSYPDLPLPPSPVLTR